MRLTIPKRHVTITIRHAYAIFKHNHTSVTASHEAGRLTFSPAKSPEETEFRAWHGPLVWNLYLYLTPTTDTEHVSAKDVRLLSRSRLHSEAAESRSLPSSLCQSSRSIYRYPQSDGKDRTLCEICLGAHATGIASLTPCVSKEVSVFWNFKVIQWKG